MAIVNSQHPLHDMLEEALPTPNNGDVLTWDATKDLWQPAAPSGGGPTIVSASLGANHTPTIGGTKILEFTITQPGFYKLEANVLGTVDYGESPFIDGSLGVYMVAPFTGDYGASVLLENRGNNAGITVYKTGGSPAFQTTHDLPFQDVDTAGNNEGILESASQWNYYHLKAGTVEFWVNDNTSNIGAVGGGRTVLAGSNIQAVLKAASAIAH